MKQKLRKEKFSLFNRNNLSLTPCMYSLFESPQTVTLISNSKLFNVSFRNDQDDLLKELLMFFIFNFAICL